MSDLAASYFDVPPADRAKAKNFFDKGVSVAGASQYDFAIEMYLNGLKLDPEAIEAHEALRQIALRRKAGGGKSLGMFGSMKFPTKGKDERQNMNNAERILAHDPGDTGAMVSLMEAAYRCGCYDTVLWIGPILNRANGELPKPDYAKFEKLRDHYAKLGRFSDAVLVCTRMVQLKPDDMDLKNDLKNLSAREAMEKGKYKQSYRDSIRNSEKQSDLLASERDQVSEDYTAKVAREAKADMASNPNDPSKVGKYVDALRKVGTADALEEAGRVLNEAFERTGAYKFRLTMIDMRLSQLKAEQRAHHAAAAKPGATPEEVQAFKDFGRARNEEELTLFEELSNQYPTESQYKFELADRQVKLGRYTDAIPLLQNAVNDPKLRTRATLALGKTFLAAEFPDEAVDTLHGLSESYPAISTGDDTAKQIMYWHGRALEAKGDLAAALKSYSQVVKWDFNYLDTQKRMKELRTKPPT